MQPSHRRPPSPRRRHTVGQGMTEYIIVVALIAVAAIATTTYFGRTVRGQVAVLAGGLAGNQNAATGAQAQATQAAGEAQAQARQTKGLNNYGTDVADH